MFRGKGLTSRDVIVPKVGVPTTRFGFPKSGRLNKLNASPRRSSLYFSLMTKSLYSAKSALINLGPMTLGMVLDAFPKVNGAGGVNAAVLNHCARLGLAT